ncbi:helix-turn-helix domain-containing protein [Pannus brasiliensis CCIBt3594]|uniref:Helix-turn-helix domain-containing protein n=1 Tax=Pannus brasiliensis CCIBt3594 TaxID=1427578 RepID=A0AAW9R026_9CHRO
MTVGKFTERLKHFQDSLHGLYRDAASGEVDSERLLSAAYKELGIASEEMQVAIEQMTAQAEELASARARLEVERQYYKSIFDFLPEPYLVTDERGTIVQVNPAAADLFKVEAARFLFGKPLEVFLSPRERREFPAKLLQLVSGERSRQWPLTLQTRQGEFREVEATVFPGRELSGGGITLHWTLRAGQGGGRSNGLVDRRDPRLSRPKAVYHQGENIPLDPANFWLVCQGWVKLSTIDEDGEVALVGLVGPSMPFGKCMTALRGYHATALSDMVQLISIGSAEINDSPTIREIVLPQLLSRLCQTESLLAISRSRQIHERLYLLLEWLRANFGQPIPGGQRLSVRLTHRELASICGTTRVTISRLLGKMKEDGKIAYDLDRHLIFIDEGDSRLPA